MEENNVPVTEHKRTLSRGLTIKRGAKMLKSTFGLATVNHQYTEEERQILNSYQSLDYMPPHSKVGKRTIVGNSEYPECCKM